MLRSSSEKLNEDVFRLILSFLTNEPSSATLISHKPMDTDHASTISSAASVCKAWYQPAIDVLYKYVRLRDAHACILFARTLQTQEHLARIVLSIQLPKIIYLHHELSERQQSASAWLGYLYETNQFAASRAVLRIVAAAVMLRDLRGPFGGIEGQGDVALSRIGVSSKLQRLDIHPGTVHWTTWTGGLDTRMDAEILHIPLLLRPSTLIWGSLHTLVITGFYGVFNLLEVDAARFAEAFPVLRELVVARTFILPATLNSLLSALRNTLRTLTLWQAIKERGCQLEPLFYVEDSCAPGNHWREAFENLEHLTCGSTEAYHRPNASKIKNIGTLTRLKSLGVSSNVVAKIAILPPQLTSLTIHVEKRYPIPALFIQDILHDLDGWISGTPGLRQLIFSVPAYIGWQAKCEQLRRRLEVWNVQLFIEVN